MTDWLNENNEVTETNEAANEQEIIEEEAAAEEVVTEPAVEEEAYDEAEQAAEEAEDEAEAENEAEAEPEVVEQPNDSVFVMGLLDLLAEELDKPATGVSFMSKPRIDTEKCLDMVQRIRANIPAGIRYSTHMAKEQERLLGRAEEESKKKLADARRAASEIKAAAEKQAEAIIAEAEAKASETIAQANQRYDAIITGGKEERKKLVAESEIVRLSQKQAAEIKKRSIADSNARHNKALEDCWNLLDALQRQVDAVSARFELKKNELYPEDGSENK